jgi:PilZ domain
LWELKLILSIPCGVKVGASNKRRSDRIVVQLPIIISGVDVLGENFADPARTVVIARYGAKIQCHRKLSPELEISIRCLMTDDESEARIVGTMSESEEGIFYGVELLHPELDLWGVEFPPIEESDAAIGRTLLQCTRCHKRELVYLNEFEAEVLQGHKSLWRACTKCRETSLWKETWIEVDEELPAELTTRPQSAVTVASPSVHEAPEVEIQPTTPPPKRTKDDRKHVRLQLKMKALIQDPQAWMEIVETENISRGGFRFQSKKHYGLGWKIEAALPCSEAGFNIFSTARVRYAVPVPGTDQTTYGVEYIPWQDVWVDHH